MLDTPSSLRIRYEWLMIQARRTTDHKVHRDLIEKAKECLLRADYIENRLRTGMPASEA